MKTHLCYQKVDIPQKERENCYAYKLLCLTPSSLSFRQIQTLACLSRDSYKWIASACLLRRKSGLIIATCVGWRLFWNATCIFLMHIWPCLLWGGKEGMEQNKFETCFPKFCFTNVKGNSEHWYFLFIVIPFHGILHHLDAHVRLVVLRCYWQNVEKWSCIIIEMKSISLLKCFLYVFLFFLFLIYHNLLFTILWKCDYNLCVSVFCSFILLLLTTT